MQSFRKWYESIFGGGSVDQQEPIPASEYPNSLNRTAYPSWDQGDLKLPGQHPKKNIISKLRPSQMKKMKN